MKAVKDHNGNIRLFRPLDHINRFRNNCVRVCLHDFDSNEYLKCLERFLKVESDWIPSKIGFSFYIRSTFISMQVHLFSN